ncbi:SDR family NAD(P)-dependent oxidoreductase [Thermodesulfobacteriota bacterium]
MGELLKGKVAVVTGSGRGLGLAHSKAMVAQGAKVVINDIGAAKDGTCTDNKIADDAVAEIKQSGGEAVANYDSIATPEGAVNLIKTAMDNFGRLDILVNNAGFIWSGIMIGDMTDEDWDTQLRIHLYGHFFCAREAAKIFVPQKSGRIINTSSIGGFGFPGLTSYAAAKEGIVGLTRSLAFELGVHGITVNCLRPTAGTRWAANPEETSKTRPAEGVSPLVVYLASDAADNVNGCIFRVVSGLIGIYRDPPYIEQTIVKDGIFTPEELIEQLPKTLTAGKAREISAKPKGAI